MIIVRSPLRISLGGGGTDLPSYYKQHDGFLIAGAIDKYVYITLHKTFQDEFILKYSQLERASSGLEVKHPIVREAIRMLEIDGRYMEIASMADIPAGTGLGSSGSFTTALLRALHAHKKSIVHPRELAEQACTIEIDKLKEPIGKQDQYIASFGGLTCFYFHRDGHVDARPLMISEENINAVEDHLVMFFTGYSRSASSILKDQDQRTKGSDISMIENLHIVKDLGFRSKTALENGDIIGFGKLMHEHWENKRRRSGDMSNPEIDSWYDLAMNNGAIGGKLIGAGGGGFLLFLTEDRARVRKAMREVGLTEVRFRFDFEGTKVLAQ